MEKNSQGFHHFSIDKAKKMAESDAGKQLYAFLESTRGETLQSAMEQAASGDYTQMQKTLQQLMQSKEARELLKKMQEE